MSQLTSQVHQMVGATLQVGDSAIDATLGNGNDALFLAERIAPTGRLFGFDRQLAALQTTQERLRRADLDHLAQLVHRGHETMGEQIPTPFHGRIRAILFNLGYLPGSDKRCTTLAATTLAALNQAAELVMSGGVITVIAYRGHPQGLEELEAVREWTAALPDEQFTIRSVQPRPGRAPPPELTIISRV